MCLKYAIIIKFFSIIIILPRELTYIFNLPHGTVLGGELKWIKTLCNSAKDSQNHSNPLVRRYVQELLRLTSAYPAGHHNNKPDYREPTVFVKANGRLIKPQNELIFKETQCFQN